MSNSNTYQNDRACLSNHDFVFFGIEFSGNKEVLPLNTTHHTVDFGANAYILDEKYEHGYFTLTDHFYNVMPPAFLHEHRDFIAQFPRARDEVQRIVHGGKGKHDVPIYNATNMRQALGMHLIDFIRSSEDQALKKFVFDDTLNESKLDKVINFVFQPEFHVPRMVSTTDYQKVSLRKMSLKDAVKACNTKELSLLIADKKDACKAMGAAIRESKDEMVAYLFDRWEFTEDDTKYISGSFDDLEYMLSNHGASTTILKEFLQRGLVLVNTPFKSVNRGDTMLDNAMKWSNNDEMISILKEYGAVRGVEFSKRSHS
ncbi:T3SS effector OspC family protein [Pseudomonas chlororaphis subsp. aurantiaca]|uniref:T3SS effector OspC family protein n=1 Tax=Pseudomonas chlororaphis TaxID=587753 RepID=UPI0027DE797C|nr:T3SS effector OspC family protein [Pseudomonas chlororaphis]WMJ01412.1 T3SS effector OspC family protein [Pseudomonas chlororaphis subsp. aurantiaca]